MTRRFGFPPEHPEMHSFLGVPIAVRGRSIGNLYLTNKRGAAEFGEDDQLLVERFARHAGLAIENARLGERVQRLAVVDERERIARDLHDGIIQRIYGVTLALDEVPEIVGQRARTRSRAGRRGDRLPPGGDRRDPRVHLRPRRPCRRRGRISRRASRRSPTACGRTPRSRWRPTFAERS